MLPLRLSQALAQEPETPVERRRRERSRLCDIVKGYRDARTDEDRNGFRRAWEAGIRAYADRRFDGDRWDAAFDIYDNCPEMEGLLQQLIPELWRRLHEQRRQPPPPQPTPTGRAPVRPQIPTVYQAPPVRQVVVPGAPAAVPALVPAPVPPAPVAQAVPGRFPGVPRPTVTRDAFPGLQIQLLPGAGLAPGAAFVPAAVTTSAAMSQAPTGRGAPDEELLGHLCEIGHDYAVARRKGNRAAMENWTRVFRIALEARVPAASRPDVLGALAAWPGCPVERVALTELMAGGGRGVEISSRSLAAMLGSIPGVGGPDPRRGASVKGLGIREPHVGPVLMLCGAIRGYDEAVARGDAAGAARWAEEYRGIVSGSGLPVPEIVAISGDLCPGLARPSLAGETPIPSSVGITPATLAWLSGMAAGTRPASTA